MPRYSNSRRGYPGGHKWSGEKTWFREISLDENGIQEVTTETYPEYLQQLAPILQQYGINYGEIVLKYKTEGYHLPSSMYGGPDQTGWAEEGDEENILSHAYILGVDLSNGRSKKYPMPDEIANALDEIFADEVNDMETEIDEGVNKMKSEYRKHFKFGSTPSINQIAGFISDEVDNPNGVLNEGFGGLRNAYGPDEVTYEDDEVLLGETVDGMPIWGSVVYTGTVHVSGGWAPATRGYSGDTPPEYPEVEIGEISMELVGVYDDDGNPAEPPENWKEAALVEFEKHGRDNMEEEASSGLTSDSHTYSEPDYDYDAEPPNDWGA